MKRQHRRRLAWLLTLLVSLSLAGSSRAAAISDRDLEPTPLPWSTSGDPDVPINPAPRIKLTCTLVDVVLKARTVPLAVLPLFLYGETALKSAAPHPAIRRAGRP